MLKTTIAFTMAHASDASNVLPQEAWVIGNMRYSHHQGGPASIEAITEFAKKFGIETEVLTPGFASSLTDHNSAAYYLVAKTINTIFPDVKPSPYLMTGASDSRYLSRVCDNCLRFVPFRITNEQMESVHGINENLDISALAPAVDFYRLIITET